MSCMLKRKRKRVKVKCLECCCKFNDDFQKKHVGHLHRSKWVKLKHIHAPNNPFKFAAVNLYTLKKRINIQVSIYF